MNQTLPTADLNTAGTTDVIPSVAIDRIIAQRNEGIALFMQAMECLATARRILLDASGDIFLYGFEDCVTDSVRRIDKPEEAKRNITRLADRKIWDRLMTDTGMYTFMSSCQRDEWNSQLMSDTCPEITLDNVLATFRHLNASKMQTFEQGAKWHLNRSQFGIRIDHDLAFISDHSLASQSITIWHASDH